MTIGTLKATRIGVLINKLTGDSDMPSTVRTLAFTIVNEWKEIANAAVQQQNNRTPTPTPPPPTTTTTTSHRPRKRTVSQMQNGDNYPRSTNSSHGHNSNKRKRMAQGPNNSALSAMTATNAKKKVPKLQNICIKQMA